MAEYVKGTTAAYWLGKAREALAEASAAMQADSDIVRAFNDATEAEGLGRSSSKEFSDFRSWLAAYMVDSRGIAQAELARLWNLTPGRVWQLVRAGRQRVGNPVTDPGTAPLLPPLALGIVTSSRGVLAVRRKDHIPEYSFPGGEMQQGESPASAVQRRVLAETGLNVTPVAILGQRIHPRTGYHTVYMACTVADEDLDVRVGDPEDLSDVEWIGLDTVRERMKDMYEPAKAHLEAVLSQAGIF